VEPSGLLGGGALRRCMGGVWFLNGTMVYLVGEMGLGRECECVCGKEGKSVKKGSRSEGHVQKGTELG